MKIPPKVLLWLGFLAIFFVPALWYANNHEIIIGGDLTFPLKPAEYFLSIFHIWRRVYTGGNSAISLTTLPFYAPMALFSALGFSLKLVQQFHFGLWLALPALGMFYLTGILFQKQPYRLVGQIIATVIYIFNTYEVVWVDSARMAVWVGLPFILAFFIQGLADKKGWPKWAAAIALISVTTSTAAANPPMFLMFLAIIFFWLIYHLLTTPEARTAASLRRIGLFMATAFGLAVLINLFWVLPYSHVLLNDYKGALNSGLKGIQFQDWLGPVSTNTSLLNVFRLQGAWDWYAGWQGEPYVPAAAPYQHNPFYLLWSVLVPIFAFAAVLIKQKSTNQRQVVFFTLLALLGLLFGAGSHPPTGSIYKWLIDHVHFLSIYRSPWYKFSTWTVLGYSVLIGTTVMAVAESFKSKKSWAVPALVTVIIAANLIYSSGLVLGKVFPTKAERVRLNSAHVTLPDYFFKAADWANQQTGDWRILQLPAQEAFNYKWGLGTLMDMSIFTFHQPTIWWPEQTGSGAAKPGSEALAKLTYDQLYTGTSDQLSRLLGLLNIRYLLQKDDIDYSFYGSIDSPEFITQRLTEAKLKLAHQEGPWRFFEVAQQDQKPLLFPTTQYQQTDATEADVAAAVLAPSYQVSTTYSSVKQSVPVSIKQGFAVRPNLDKMTLAGSQFKTDLTVPATGQYQLSFQATEPINLTIDGQAVDLTTADQVAKATLNLQQGKHQLTVTNPGQTNLIADGDFANGPWGPVTDASKTWAGPADFGLTTLADGSSGQAIELSSRNHSAAITRGVDSFDPTRRYLLSFDYRYQTGMQPRFGIWQEGASIIQPLGTLEKQTAWTNYQTVFRSRPTAKGLTLFLYADPGQTNPQPTTIDYDQVTVVKLPKALDTLELTSVLPLPGNVPTVTYDRTSSTHYQVKIDNAQQPFILNFLEQFDPGWQLRVAGQAKPAVHLSTYSYANGWVIDQTGNLTATIDFTPQKTFTWSAIVSVLGVILSLWLIYRRRPNVR